MRLCVPDWRWRQIIEAIDKDDLPVDPYASFVCQVLKGIKEEPVIRLAVDSILDYEYRDHLVAFILSGSTPEATCKCLDMKLDVYNSFKKLYMDMETFRHRMEKRRYAKYYIAEVCEDKDAKKLLKKGIIEGPAGIESFWNMAHEPLPYTPKEMYRSVTEMAYTKAISARYSDLSAEETKESLKWTTNLLKALTKVDLMSFDSLNTDLDSLVSIQRQEYTHTAEELGLTPADILN